MTQLGTLLSGRTGPPRQVSKSRDSGAVTTCSLEGLLGAWLISRAVLRISPQPCKSRAGLLLESRCSTLCRRKPRATSAPWFGLMYARGLPISNACLDAVFAGEIIEHLVDTDSFIAEIARVLRPGGHTVITTPNLASFENRLRLLAGIYPISGGSSRRRRGARPGIHPTGFEEAACPAPSRSYCSRW